MTTIATNYMTMVDIMKQTVGESIESDIAEIMSESSDILTDMHMKECNQGTFNKSVVRHGLPKTTFRKLYGYVPTSKSTVEQVVDVTGNLESYSTPDVDLIDHAKNPAQARMKVKRLLKVCHRMRRIQLFMAQELITMPLLTD